MWIPRAEAESASPLMDVCASSGVDHEFDRAHELSTLSRSPPGSGNFRVAVTDAFDDPMDGDRDTRSTIDETDSRLGGLPVATDTMPSTAPSSASAIRTPPQNTEAEACVLGSLMLDNDVLGVMGDILRPTDFYDAGHRKIYTAAIDLYQDGVSVDAVTVRDRLSSTGQLETIGGIEKLISVQETVPSAAHALDYARIVRDRAVKRHLISIADEVIREAYGSEKPASDMLDAVESELFRLAEGGSGTEPADIRDVMHGAFRLIDKARENKGAMTGCGTRYYELDSMTNGFEAGQLIILAARPSVGKTTFALNCAINMAMHYKKSVAVFSLEMSKEQIGTNMLCAAMNARNPAAPVSGHKVRKGVLSNAEWDKVVDTASALTTAPIFVDDTPGLSVTALRGKARRLKRRHGIDCVIIDYLQLMDAPRADNRQQEISIISRSLKALAREIEVPVIALSQINRAAEKEARKPRMSDLRESGAIEQDADIIMFLYDPEYQKEAENAEGGDDPVPQVAPPPGGYAREIQLIVAKQRNGPTGLVNLRFFRDQMRFDNQARM